jgi:cytochrome P450
MTAPFPAGPRSLLGIGTLLQLRTKDLLQLSEQLTARHGKLVHARMFHKHLYFISDPDLVAEVLGDATRTYDKIDTRSTIHHIAGDSLNTLRLDQGWAEKQALFERHLASSARIEGIAVDEVDALLARWEESAAAGHIVPAGIDLLRLTTSIASRTFFHQGVDDIDFAELDTLKYRVVRSMLARQLQLVRLPKSLDRGLVRAFRFRDRLVARVIEKHLVTDGRPDSYIGDLVAKYGIRAADRLAVRLTRGEILSALYLASDPFDKLLVKALQYLALHPVQAERLRVELRELEAGDGLTPRTASTLRRLRHFLLEVLRLRTPYAIVGREALVDHELGGYRVPKGSLLAITPLIVHKDPDHWERPEEFDPSRFETLRLATATHFVPFSAGERRCPGQGFAMRQAMYILARIVGAFDVELVPGFDYADEFMGVLSSKHPYRFALRARETVAVG